MEEFRDIEGYDGYYQISNLGRVKNKVRGKILSNHIVNTNYYMVDLYLNKVRKKYYIHRLVASAFIPTIEGKLWVNHKNFIRLDNRLENLEWCNPSENVQHSYDNGANPKGSLRRSTKLTEQQVIEIKHKLKDRIKQYVIANEYGVSYVTISDIKREIYWKQIKI